MKYIAKIAAFTAIFLIINLIFCGFMPPDNGSSLGMWRSYHQKSSPLTLPSLVLPLASAPCPKKNSPPQQGRPLH